MAGLILSQTQHPNSGSMPKKYKEPVKEENWKEIGGFLATGIQGDKSETWIFPVDAERSTAA